MNNDEMKSPITPSSKEERHAGSGDKRRPVKIRIYDNSPGNKSPISKPCTDTESISVCQQQMPLLKSAQTIGDTLENIRMYLKTEGTENSTPKYVSPIVTSTSKNSTSIWSAHKSSSIEDFNLKTTDVPIIKRPPWIYECESQDSSTGSTTTVSSDKQQKTSKPTINTTSLTNNKFNRSKLESEQDITAVDSATSRFNRFLERLEKQPAFRGVKVDVKPEISTEIMEQITKAYNRQYLLELEAVDHPADEPLKSIEEETQKDLNELDIPVPQPLPQLGTDITDHISNAIRNAKIPDHLNPMNKRRSKFMSMRTKGIGGPRTINKSPQMCSFQSNQGPLALPQCPKQHFGREGPPVYPDYGKFRSSGGNFSNQFIFRY